MAELKEDYDDNFMPHDVYYARTLNYQRDVNASTRDDGKATSFSDKFVNKAAAIEELVRANLKNETKTTSHSEDMTIKHQHLTLVFVAM